MKKELAELEGMFQYYHYVIQRNDAQKGSFVSEDAQWEFMDPYDQNVIENHPRVVERMGKLQSIIMASIPADEHGRDDER